MKTESLERLLREKIETDKPRSGFETRLQALAREPAPAKKKNFPRALGFAFAALALTVALPHRNPAPQVAQTPAPRPVSPPTVDGFGLTLFSQAPQEESSVSKEIAEIKNDARRAFDFLSDTVPSMTVK